MDKVFIVIPAFNEAKAIAGVISDLKAEGYRNIVIVDDGSRDNTSEVAKKSGAIVLRHIINRGKGAATQTGLDAAKLLDADYVVTIDADGQHNPKEIKSLLKILQSQAVDVVLGSRLMSANKIPFSRKIANIIGNVLTYIFYGIYVSDSQSGFRGYNKKALSLIKTTFDRYEFESEVLHQMHIHKLSYTEVPITVRYSDYSMNKWKSIKDVPSQTFMNGFRMLFRMIIRTITT